MVSERERDKGARRGSGTARMDASCAGAVHWCAGAVACRGGGGEECGRAASNDRARVASFTRSCGRRTTAAPPCPFGPYYSVYSPSDGRGYGVARFSTRSPLQKWSHIPQSFLLLALEARGDCLSPSAPYDLASREAGTGWDAKLASGFGMRWVYNSAETSMTSIKLFITKY